MSAANGYESVPALVSMADVFINTYGYVWNDMVRPRADIHGLWYKSLGLQRLAHAKAPFS